MNAAKQQQHKFAKVQRWCPPKALVGLQPIERLLNRKTFMVCPESRLVVAVITRAIGDCLSLGNKRQRRGVADTFTCAGYPRPQPAGLV